MSAKPDARLRFAECGLSERVMAALSRSGIDTPEQLLFMDPARIRLLHGIGPTLMKEIERYRARATSARWQ